MNPAKQQILTVEKLEEEKVFVYVFLKYINKDSLIADSLINWITVNIIWTYMLVK